MKLKQSKFNESTNTWTISYKAYNELKSIFIEENWSRREEFSDDEYSLLKKCLADQDRPNITFIN